MRTLFCFVLFTAIAYSAFSQIKENEILGKWKMIYTNNPNLWMFHRFIDDNNISFHFGTFIEFKEDHSYIQHASAPCGNDDDRYNFNGKWELNANNEVVLQINLKTSGRRPNIYNNYTLLKDGKLKVILAQKDTLQLLVIKNWEKLSPKSTNY